MNFMLAGDGNYTNQMIVAMTSIIANHPARSVHFHMFLSDIAEEDVKKISSLSNSADCKIDVYRMEDYLHYFSSIDPRNSHNPHVSMASNYRLIMTQVLSDDVSKCFYVDSDMVVDCCLSDVYDSLSDDELALVVPEVHSMEYREMVLSRLDDWEEFSKYREDPLSYPYFNAGFFLLNVKLAKEVNMFSLILDFISKHDFIPYTDQDILNAVIGQMRPGKVRILPPHYDVFWNTDHYVRYSRAYHSPEEIQDSFEHPKVIHFCGPWKPWDCGGWPHYELWWKYAEMSPVASEFLVGNKRELSDLSYDAMRYRFAWGVEKDLQRSFDCIMEIVRNGIGQAVSYAIDTAKELGYRDAIQELAPYAAKEAEKGNGDCAIRLGQAYRDGMGVEWNLDLAIYWMQKAYDSKLYWCKPELYDVMKWKCDMLHKDMFNVASSGSADGNAMSMVQLGRCYRDGIGVPKDLDLAKEWISKGAESNIVYAFRDISFASFGCRKKYSMLYFSFISSIKNKGIKSTMFSIFRFLKYQIYLWAR